MLSGVVGICKTTRPDLKIYLGFSVCPLRVFISFCLVLLLQGFLGGSVVKNPAANAGDARSVPGLGRWPGGGHGNPLQYSCPWRIPRTEEHGRLHVMGLQESQT